VARREVGVSARAERTDVHFAALALRATMGSSMSQTLQSCGHHG